MQQRDRFAFVAGMSIGLWGGALGAFLTCTAARAAMCRLLDQLDERPMELSPPELKATVKATLPESAARMVSR